MRHRDESGAVVFAGLMFAGLLVLVAVASGLAVLIIAKHRQAQNGADLAALAGANALQSGAIACEEAQRFATANGLKLADCQRAGDAVSVVVVARLAVGPWAVTLPARAKAGLV